MYKISQPCCLDFLMIKVARPVLANNCVSVFPCCPKKILKSSQMIYFNIALVFAASSRVVENKQEKKSTRSDRIN